MAEKKFVESITAMDADFTQWYTDVVRKADLVDYATVRGCMIIRPYGYAIWENIQRRLDRRFRETGHENVYMPLFIPESLLQKEKEHVEGFAPEVAWVTHGGAEKLPERLCVRPTSETLFCDHYRNIIHSYRDLPKLYNQWCSVVRWEKTTRPFLRTLEFLWQEGHTAHATAEDAQAETLRMLDTYADFCEKELAIPVIKGRKTDKEKFAGARATYTIESMMHDGKALQSGTSHNFGDGFARAFGIQYTDANNQLKYVHQTSWGMSTRIIGAIIMVHGDDSGLVLPPEIAPIQLVIIPVSAHLGNGVMEKAEELKKRLSGIIRVTLDASDRQPGWKFSEYEMKGVPLRLEIGPRDMEKNQVMLVRRDTREKIPVPMEQVETAVPVLLQEIRDSLYAKALAMRDERIYTAEDMAELEVLFAEKPGFVRAAWCGSRECEDRIKEKTGATARCIPFGAAGADADAAAEAEAPDGARCVCCREAATRDVIWGKAY